MEPTLKEGGIVYYKKTNVNDLKVDDIITFKMNDTVVSHRIIEVKDNAFGTKGDANNTADTNDVPFEDVLGKDTNFCIPILGYYVKFINNNLYVVIPIILILILEFYLSNKNFDINDDERSEN